ncbi:MAG: OmpH family outer membrane protein [Deltaproteobacteria bacterium]|nr:MAG: OmpH family outer membrane protein [Deltaproteobacteria bacterium]
MEHLNSTGGLAVGNPQTPGNGRARRNGEVTMNGNKRFEGSVSRFLPAMTAGAVLLFAMAVPVRASAAERIGYVNLSKVFENTEEGKQILGKLKAEFSKRQKELDKKMKAFEEKAKRFQQRQAVLKDEARQQEAQKLAEEQRQLQMLFMQYQQEIDRKKAEALGQFENKVLDVVRRVARRDGLTYVFRQEALIYGPQKMDITNEVIREYDKLHGAGKKGGKKKGK